MDRGVPLISCGSKDCLDRMEGASTTCAGVLTCHSKAMAPGDNTGRKLVGGRDQRFMLGQGSYTPAQA